MLATGGCAANHAGPLGINGLFGRADLAAAEPLFGKEEDKCLDSPTAMLELEHALRDQKHRIDYVSCNSVPVYSGLERSNRSDVSEVKAKREGRPAGFAIEVHTAARIPALPHEREVTHRNEVIDSMVAASDRKCSRYTALIKNADGAVNGGLSALAILTGGLGAFVGGPAAAKALSGTASILTGTRAALDET